ncbi:hypothetical protein TWF694_007727 [Orbilia ellipsospora]|uniref:Ankyrin n=1 Tax=Orbilia ellipsospora TaxID=2528407 RepID=A0AAV9XIK6_9PEZI
MDKTIPTGELESLTISEPRIGLLSLPVEIFRNIINHVVLTTGFYASLEIRLVNKLFDTITLDEVLDTPRKAHKDSNSVTISDELSYTALHRRVIDSVVRSPPIVSTIRTISQKLLAHEPALDIVKIHKCLCWITIMETPASSLFARLKADYDPRQSAIKDRIQELEVIEFTDEVLDWFLAVYYTVFYEFDNFKRVCERIKERPAGDKKTPWRIDYISPIFGPIPIMAVRFATEELAIWAYENSTICAYGGTRREEYLRYTSIFGRQSIILKLFEESKTREKYERVLSFGDCPRWAAGAGGLEMVQTLLHYGDDFDVYEDVSQELEWVFLAACTHGHYNVALWCVDGGNLKPRRGSKGKGLRYGRPLCQATQSGNVEMVRLLMGLKDFVTQEDLVMSFKWAMRYAGLDMVQLYFEKGLKIDDEMEGNKTRRKILKVIFDTASKERPQHVEWILEHKVVLEGEDKNAAVRAAANGGAVKCLGVLKKFIRDWEQVANTEIRKAYDLKDRRAVEVLLKVGAEPPEGWNETQVRGWEYSSHIVALVSHSRKKSGYWPQQWNYGTVY